eukprot:m.196731 g.196731  ORF g.196731 m.196731 type:complete len:77 (+) comp18700_c0_seq2:239-469(+)
MQHYYVEPKWSPPKRVLEMMESVIAVGHTMETPVTDRMMEPSATAVAAARNAVSFVVDVRLIFRFLHCYFFAFRGG